VMKATKKSGTGSGSGDNSDNIMRYINWDITRNQLGKLWNYTMDDIINVALGVSPQKALKLLKSDNWLSTDMAIVELTKYVYNNGGDNEKVASVLKDIW
jgi:rRNA processing protein Krr1/Pno1